MTFNNQYAEIHILIIFITLATKSAAAREFPHEHVIIVKLYISDIDKVIFKHFNLLKFIDLFYDQTRRIRFTWKLTSDVNCQASLQND